MAQVFKACEWLENLIKEEGPFDGVMGFSQGSVTSVATMLRHAELHPEDPADALFRFAILFSMPNLPPDDADGTVVDWGKISIPSLHICGEQDEWFEMSKFIHGNNFEKGTAKIIIHKGGHLVPKDRPTVDRISNAIEDLLERDG
jgi:pimeloyl-ACP methyl ester carboxylesterase